MKLKSVLIFSFILIAVLLAISSGVAASEEIGEWNGVSYDDPNPPEEYTEGETVEYVTNRTIARVEYIRGEPFHGDTEIRVMTQSEYSGDLSFIESDQWGQSHQFKWSSLLVSDDKDEIRNNYRQLFSGSVQGFYRTGSPETITLLVDRNSAINNPSQWNMPVVAHELTHAHQDATYNLQTVSDDTTFDSELATTAVIEGDAVYVERTYEDKCLSGYWECVNDPSVLDIGQDSPPQPYHLYEYSPYAEGYRMINEFYDTADESENIEELYIDTPDSMSEIMFDQEYTDMNGYTGLPNSWEIKNVDQQGVVGIYMMLWDNQSYLESNYSLFNHDEAQSDEPRYSNELVKQIRGDSVTEFVTNEDSSGFVFQIKLESRSDAEELEQKFERILSERGTSSSEGNVYNLSDSVNGVFSVEQSENIVRVYMTEDRSSHSMFSDESISFDILELLAPNAIWYYLILFFAGALVAAGVIVVGKKFF